MTPDLVPLLQGTPGLRVQINDLLGADGGMLFNTLHPPFDNPAIKQADFITGDIARARAALVAAGYKGERVVVMQVGDYATLGALAEIGADTLRRIGMNVDVQVVDYGTMAQRRGNKNPPDKGGWSVYFAWYSGMNRFDPASHLTARGDGSYYGWANVPRLRALRDAWFDAGDLAAQQAVARDIQITMLEVVPFIPLGEYFPSAATRTALGAVGRGVPLFYNIKKG